MDGNDPAVVSAAARSLAHIGVRLPPSQVARAAALLRCPKSASRKAALRVLMSLAHLSTPHISGAAT